MIKYEYGGCGGRGNACLSTASRTCAMRKRHSVGGLAMMSCKFQLGRYFLRPYSRHRLRLRIISSLLIIWQEGRPAGRPGLISPTLIRLIQQRSRRWRICSVPLLSFVCLHRQPLHNYIPSSVKNIPKLMWN